MWLLSLSLTVLLGTASRIVESFTILERGEWIFDRQGTYGDFALQ
jgi:hypothetical protein